MRGDRLRAARSKAGLTQTELAVALGDRYTGSMISMVEHGHSALLLDGATAAARELGVSLDYLVGLTDDPRPAAELAAAFDGSAGDAVTPISIPKNGNGYPARRPLFEKHFSVFPRLGNVRAAAGPGALFDDESITGYIAFPTAWVQKRGLVPEHCNAFETWGESMLPSLEDDAMILVDHQRTSPIHDRIFVVHTDAGVVAKRLMRNDQGVWTLVSDNPDKSQYPALEMPREAKILGQVVWTGKTLL